MLFAVGKHCVRYVCLKKHGKVILLLMGHRQVIHIKLWHYGSQIRSPRTWILTKSVGNFFPGRTKSCCMNNANNRPVLLKIVHLSIRDPKTDLTMNELRLIWFLFGDE